MEYPSSFAALFNRQRPNTSKKDDVLGAFKTSDNNNSLDTSMPPLDTFASLFTKRTVTENKRKGEIVLPGPSLPVPKKTISGNTEYLISLQETKTFPHISESKESLLVTQGTGEKKFSTQLSNTQPRPLFGPDLSTETTSENTVRYVKNPSLNVPIKTELNLETTNQPFLKPTKNNIPNRNLHTESLHHTVQEYLPSLSLFERSFPIKSAENPPKGLSLFQASLPKENPTTPLLPTSLEVHPNSLKEEKLTKEVKTEGVGHLTTPDVVSPVWSEKNDLMETETTPSRTLVDETPSSPLQKNDFPGPKVPKTVTEIQDQMVTGTTYVQTRVEDLTESLCHYEEKLKELSVKLALLNNEVLILNTPLAKILFDERYQTTREE